MLTQQHAEAVASCRWSRQRSRSAGSGCAAGLNYFGQQLGTEAARRTGVAKEAGSLMVMASAMARSRAGSFFDAEMAYEIFEMAHALVAE